MGDSMSTIINATTTNGVVIQPDNSGSLALQTNNGTAALTIDTSQNVGIGTSSFALSAAGRGDLEIAGSSTAVVGLKGGSNQAYVFNDGTNVYVANASASGNIVFQPSTNTERMRINSSGKLIMASVADGTPGTIQAGITNNTGSTNAVICAAANQNGAYPLGARGESTSQGLIGFFNSSDTAIAAITKSGNSVAYNTSSDYRLKENIIPMTGALNKVAQLKPVTYTWKEDGSSGQGFIAHELQEVISDAVFGEKDAVETYTDEEGNEQTRIKPQGIDTSFLVATLTAAIQEQQTIINDLKARVETLEAK
jgi:hypothetical protein